MKVSAENSYTEDHLMKTFSDNLQKWGNYYAQIEINQAELRREEKFIDHKSLTISDLQIDYLNLDNSVRNIERVNVSQSIWSHCGGSHPTEKML